jgi:3-deoxy-D-manno-octulosonate 8-phosphate phosphatase (KDO 8-P phosphatase)
MHDKFSAITLLVCDVDGVLTDGKITYDASGGELKSFHAHDGAGLKILQQHGVTVAIITARQSKIVARRMQELGIEYVYQGCKNKLQQLCALAEQLQLTPEQIAYVGDDVPDVPAMQYAGVAFTVADATAAAKKVADCVSTLNGGHGAVRQLCEWLLESRGISL